MSSRSGRSKVVCGVTILPGVPGCQLVQIPEEYYSRSYLGSGDREGVTSNMQPAVITDITVVPTMPGSPRGHRIKLFTKQIGKLLRVIKHLCQTGFISGNHITY